MPATYALTNEVHADCGQPLYVFEGMLVCESCRVQVGPNTLTYTAECPECGRDFAYDGDPDASRMCSQECREAWAAWKAAYEKRETKR